MLTNGVINELRAIVGQKYVMTELEDLLIYSNDATVFHRLPDAVARPGSREEVAALVKLAAGHKIPLTPRGAATCLSGGAIPLKGGLVVDLTRLNRVRCIDAVNKIAVVEAGCVAHEITERAAQLGLFYPPDPSSNKESTIGGNVSECAGGPRGVKYGITRNFVLGLEVVLPDGSVVETGNAVDGEMCGPDWTMLFTGSEGTMAIITAAALRLAPAPEAKKTMLAIYDRLEDAAKTVSVTMSSGIIPTTLELIDNLSIVAVEKTVSIGLPVEAAGLLLIEVDGVLSTVEENIRRVGEICRRHGAREVKIAQNAAEAENLWVARRAIAKAFGQIAPCKFAEDSTVPRSLIPQLVEKCLEIQRKCQLPMLIVGHAGDGNMHPTIMFDKRDKDAVARAEKALDEIHLATLALGGTLSGEHGIGFAKAPYLRAEMGEVGFRLGRDVKTVVDPQGIMNPGKMFHYEGAQH